MHDNDTPESLRKQTLKHNGKTLSRKAQARLSTLDALSPPGSKAGSKIPSRATSAAPSRPESNAGSRPQSRLDFSDDDFRDLDGRILRAVTSDNSDDETSYIGSLTELADSLLDGGGFWKRSTPQSRVQTLAQYVRALMGGYEAEQVEGFADGMVELLKKVVRTDDSNKEVIMAIKGLALTLVTIPSSGLYHNIAPVLRTTISNSHSALVKAEAINALTLVSFFGETARTSNMALFREIVDSDGLSIDPRDKAEPVAAAIHGWSLLATASAHVPEPGESIRVFMDQLASTSVAVTIAAGQAIALIYEKQHTNKSGSDSGSGSDNEGDDEGSDHASQKSGSSADVDADRAEDPDPEGQNDFDDFDSVYHEDLLLRLRTLAKTSERRFSAAERRGLHGAFTDVAACVADPSRGPQYSDAETPEGAAVGHRLRLKMGARSVATVTAWWELVRLNALKAALKDGFDVHWRENEAVGAALPLEVEELANWRAKGGKGGKGRKRKGARSPRFVE